MTKKRKKEKKNCWIDRYSAFSKASEPQKDRGNLVRLGTLLGQPNMLHLTKQWGMQTSYLSNYMIFGNININIIFFFFLTFIIYSTNL